MQQLVRFLRKEPVKWKELAYKGLIFYFNDYRNASLYGSSGPEEATWRNYGHRIPLLAASGTGMAVGASSKKEKQAMEIMEC